MKFLTRLMIVILLLNLLAGCVPYNKSIENDKKDHLDKFVSGGLVFVGAIEKYKNKFGYYPVSENRSRYKIGDSWYELHEVSKEFEKNYLKPLGESSFLSFDNFESYYKLGSIASNGRFISPHIDHRQLDLIRTIMRPLSYVTDICAKDDCILNKDEGRLIYYGGDTSKINPSEIILNKSEEKLGITREQKLKEILSCNSQIFLPKEKQTNTDKCYRGWYNEIIER